MKKHTYILSVLIILLVFSCGQNSSEKKLNGKWYEVENEYQSWHFYPDSLVFTENKVEWEASDSKIEFDYITYIWDSIGKQIDYQDKIIFNYKLNNDNDSLFGIIENKYEKYEFSLLKAENYIEFLNKKFGIKFLLPQNDSAELIERNAIYGLKVFMGSLDDKIVVKTELSDNLNNLETSIKKFKDSIKPYEQRQIDTHEMFLDRRFHLRVFADRQIHDSTITKHLKATIPLKNSEIDKYYPESLRGLKRDSLPIKIFRIYNTKEETNPWNIKGKEIKTNAYNVYN